MMLTLRSARARLKAISDKHPSSDPAADVARIHAMLEPMAGLIGCGDEPTDNEKKGGDGEKPG